MRAEFGELRGGYASEDGGPAAPRSKQAGLGREGRGAAAQDEVSVRSSKTIVIAIAYPFKGSGYSTGLILDARGSFSTTLFGSVCGCRPRHAAAPSLEQDSLLTCITQRRRRRGRGLLVRHEHNKRVHTQVMTTRKQESSTEAKAGISALRPGFSALRARRAQCRGR